MINSIHKKVCNLTPSYYQVLLLLQDDTHEDSDDNIDSHLSKQQFGFRKNRGTVEYTFTVRQIMEKANEH